MRTTLKNLSPDDKAVIISIGNKGAIRRRLLDMGVTPGAKVTMKKIAPFGDPIEIHIRGYELTLRKDEAEQVEVEKI